MVEEDVGRVFWDLETTDRSSKSRIVSIGWALAADAPNELLVLPAEESTPQAIEVHGWTRGRLMEHGALGVDVQLAAFFRSLERLGPIVLCAHNGKSFDTRVLRAEMARHNLKMPPNVIGFVDTLHWLRSTVGIRPTNLDHLIRLTGSTPRSIHSSGEDAALLCKISMHYMSSHALSHFESTQEWMSRTQTLYEEVVDAS